MATEIIRQVPVLMLIAAIHEALKQNLDPYKAVAAVMFNINIREVSRPQRKMAKDVLHVLSYTPAEQINEKAMLEVAIDY